MEDYTKELEKKTISFYDREALSVLRQMHHLVVDKGWLLDVFEAPLDAPSCRDGANFIPFSEEELDELRT